MRAGLRKPGGQSLSQFSVVEAALSGPRLLLRKPAVILVLIAFNVVALAIYLIVMTALFGDMVRQLLDMIASGATPTPQFFLPLIPKAALAFLIMLPLTLVYRAVPRAAITRAILFPNDDAFGYVRFGGDELRLAMVIFVIGVIRFLAQLVLGILGGIVVAILIGMSGGFRNPDPTAMQGAQQLINIPIWIAMAYLYIKFCLAPALTLDTRAINVFDSWRLTKGHGWNILLSYLIVAVMWLAGGVVVFILSMIVVFALGGDLIGIIQQMESNPAQAARALVQALIPILIGVGIVSAFIGPFFYATGYAPSAYIYRTVVRPPEDEVFE